MAHWDDIIIGNGLTGACVARTFADAGRRVLIIERGRAVSDPPGSHLRNLADQRNDPDGWFQAVDRYVTYLDPDAPASALPGAYTSSIVGGSGILWTNNCPRATAGLDRPEQLSEREWEGSYRQVEGRTIRAGIAPPAPQLWHDSGLSAFHSLVGRPSKQDGSRGRLPRSVTQASRHDPGLSRIKSLVRLVASIKCI